MYQALHLVTDALEAVASWFLQFLGVTGVKAAYIMYLIVSMVCIIMPAVIAIAISDDDSKHDKNKPKSGGKHHD